MAAASLPAAGIPAMSAMQGPPLCPQRVRSPSKQEARIRQAPSVGEQKGGSATGGAAAAGVPVPPCSQPSTGSHGELPEHSPYWDPHSRAESILSSLQNHFFNHLEAKPGKQLWRRQH